MQTKHKILTAVAILLALVVGVLVGPYVQLRRKPVSVLIERLRIYTLVFEVGDADTGQLLNASVSLPSQSMEEPLFPALAEMPPGGPYRVTCVGAGPQEVSVGSEGYERKAVSLQEFDSHQYQAAALATRTIRLTRKADPEGIPDVAERPGSHD